MPEPVQRGTAANGHGIVLFIEGFDSIADPASPTESEIAAGERITYGLTPDGFTHDTSVAVITTGRYTLDQALELDGIVTDTVEVQWVYNRANPTDVELLLGKPGVEGYIVHALGYENGHDLESGDTVNAIIPVTTGIPRDVPPTENTELRKIQKLNVSGVVQREVTISGGGA